MTHYKQLSTEKYYHDSVFREMMELRRQKNRDAVRGFGQFVFTAAVVLFTAYAINEMPNWLPMVTAFMDEYGITEKLVGFNETIQTWLRQ